MEKAKTVVCETNEKSRPFFVDTIVSCRWKVQSSLSYEYRGCKIETEEICGCSSAIFAEGENTTFLANIMHACDFSEFALAVKIIKGGTVGA